MFRLLFRLFTYGLVGYCLYEFFRGATSGEIGPARRAGREFAGQGSGIAGRAGGATLTGPGRGRSEQTQEPDGGSVRHRVGRGAAV